MKTDLLFKLIVIILLGLLLYLNMCSKNTAVSKIDSEIKKTRAEIAEINKQYKNLMAGIDSIRQKRFELNRYYKYEITKIDSVYAVNNSYTAVDSIIRAWTDSIYSLPGFFNNFKQTGTAVGKQDSTAGGELLLPGIKLEKRNGPVKDSSW